MDSKPRMMAQKCVSWLQPAAQTIVVHQVIAEKEVQKAMDICIKVPEKKPAVEQVINVYVNKIHITRVDVVTDAVIVCGYFDVKVIYAACLPTQPVHAVEKRCVKFVLEACIPGARHCMDADASVAVEFVDYYCHKHRNVDSFGHGHPKYEHCKNYDECEECEPSWHFPCESSKKGCTRRIDVSVVLKVVIRVMQDREIILYPAVFKPKG